MTRLKRPSAAALLGLLVVAGISSALTGLYLLVGLPWVLVAGGVTAVGLGLLVDVD